MSGFADALAQAVDMLKERDIAAARHARDLYDLPAVLVAPASMVFDRLDGKSYTYEVELWLLARETGHEDDALEDLSALAEKVREVFHPTRFEAQSVQVKNLGGLDPLPALRTTVKLNVQPKEDE